MAKIPDYPALTAPNNNDKLVIEDSVSSSTKHVTRSNFLKGTPLPADTVDTQAVTDSSVTSSKLSLDFAEATFGSGFTSSASNTWQDTGFDITLPSAGTWLLMGEMRLETPTTSGAFVVARYYNTTTTTTISNSERIGNINVNAAAAQHTTPVNSRVVTTTANNVIRVEIQPGGAYVGKLDSDANGRSHMMAFRVG